MSSKILDLYGAKLLRMGETFEKFLGQKLKDIGLHFGIGVSDVSQASRRIS